MRAGNKTSRCHGPQRGKDTARVGDVSRWRGLSATRGEETPGRSIPASPGYRAAAAGTVQLDSESKFHPIRQPGLADKTQTAGRAKSLGFQGASGGEDKPSMPQN